MQQSNLQKSRLCLLTDEQKTQQIIKNNHKPFAFWFLILMASHVKIYLMSDSTVTMHFGINRIDERNGKLCHHSITFPSNIFIHVFREVIMHRRIWLGNFRRLYRTLFHTIAEAFIQVNKERGKHRWVSENASFKKCFLEVHGEYRGIWKSSHYLHTGIKRSSPEYIKFTCTLTDSFSKFYRDLS